MVKKIRIALEKNIFFYVFTYKAHYLIDDDRQDFRERERGKNYVSKKLKYIIYFAGVGGWCGGVKNKNKNKIHSFIHYSNFLFQLVTSSHIKTKHKSEILNERKVGKHAGILSHCFFVVLKTISLPSFSNSYVSFWNLEEREREKEGEKERMKKIKQHLIL